MYDRPFQEKNVFDYHAVIASALQQYFNVRMEAEDTIGVGAAREDKARAILRSCIIYAVKLKPNDYRNDKVPSDYMKLALWLDEKEVEFGRGKKKLLYLDAMFALATEKMEIAGLTASKENDYTPQSDRQLSEMLGGKK